MDSQNIGKMLDFEDDEQKTGEYCNISHVERQMLNSRRISMTLNVEDAEQQNSGNFSTVEICNSQHIIIVPQVGVSSATVLPQPRSWAQPFCL